MRVSLLVCNLLGGLPRHVLDALVGTRFKQHLRKLEMPQIARLMERGVLFRLCARGLLYVDIGAVTDHLPSNLHVVHLRGPDQRQPATLFGRATPAASVERNHVHGDGAAHARGD